MESDRPGRRISSMSKTKTTDNEELVPFYRETTVEKAPETGYNKTVKLQSQLDARLLYTGKVSQRQYEWPRAGSVVSVDERDVDELLSKRTKKQSCCSGSDIAVFIKVD
jgi:hypothetical protein